MRLKLKLIFLLTITIERVNVVGGPKRKEKMLYVNIIPLQQSFVLHSSSDPVTLSSRLVLFFFLSVGGGE